MTAPPFPFEVRSGTDDRAGTASAIWPILTLVGIVGLVALTAALIAGVVFPFDRAAIDLAKTWTLPRIVWEGISQTANIPLIVAGVGFVVWLLWHRRFREAILVVIVLAAITGGSEGLKQLTLRPRPAGNGDGIPGVIYSYPSGHVLECLTILGMITLRVWRTTRHRRLAAVLVALVAVEVILVGIARIGLLEHYPTDLMGGLFGAIAALGVYGWLTRPGGWADRPPLAAKAS
jgi:undecaprenyl-diphosphatase